MPTTDQVRAMREETGLGVMECKTALVKQERLEALGALQARIWQHSQHDPIASVIDDLIGLLIEERQD